MTSGYGLGLSECLSRGTHDWTKEQLFANMKFLQVAIICSYWSGHRPAP